jgi:hypothetical protein
MTLSIGNDYSKREIDNLAGDDALSTDAAVNQLANHAGVTNHYTLRSDDKTERQIKADHQDAQVRPGASGLGEHGVAEGGELALEHFAHVAAEPVLLPLSLVTEQLKMMKDVGEDGITGRERAEAFTKDQLHVYVLGNLSGLPKDYQTAQLAKYPEMAKTSNLQTTLNKNLGHDGDHQLMARIQLHCDQGMNAARFACDTGVGKDAYLQQHPEVAKRCVDDVAYAHGFDAVFSAHGQGAAQYKEVVDALKSRDARYDAAHVVRG